MIDQNKTYSLILTHEVLIVVVVGVIDDPVSILLVVAAHATGLEVFRVDGALALKARLSEAVVQTLAETSSGDF